jgi:predicted dithiol-disulfide oxidoreductase (DUF899 family)
MVRIDKKYVFAGPKGKMSLLDLFEGRRQLILYHFMFAPPVPGWPDAGCVGCSMVTDQFGHTAHFHARDTSFCLVSLAPLKNIEKFKKRMGWTYPWYSSDGTDFNKDFGLTTDKGENYGLSVFIHDDKDVYRTYHHRRPRRRGAEHLDIPRPDTPGPAGGMGRLTAGGPRTKPFVWWRRHDEYGKDSGGPQS